jgi:alpha-1,3-rhamnosyl/mannosyltransferase
MIVGIDARLGVWRGRGWGRYCSDFLCSVTDASSVEWRALLPDTPAAHEFADHLADSVSVVFAPFRPPSVPAAATHALRASDPARLLGGIDVLHVLTRFVPATSVGAVVTTVHDIAPLSEPPFKTEVRAATLEALDRIRGLRAHMLAVSEFTARELTAQPNVDPRRIHVVHSGVRLKPVARRAGSSGDSAFRLLYVGGAGANKNLLRLLEAVADLRSDMNVDLVLVGDAVWGYEDLPERFRSAPWIRHEGLVSDQRLAALYAEASALVLPSLHEGFGLPLLEAMVAGTPILCSRIPVFEEIAGGAARYFDPHEVASIARVLRESLLDPNSLETSARLGLERVRTFDWSRAVTDTISVYRAALDSLAVALT